MAVLRGCGCAEGVAVPLDEAAVCKECVPQESDRDKGVE